MNDQAFQLIRDDLKEIKELMQAHIKEDAKTHRVVERHSVYFSFMYLGIPTAVAYVAKKLGWY